MSIRSIPLASINTASAQDEQLGFKIVWLVTPSAYERVLVQEEELSHVQVGKVCKITCFVECVGNIPLSHSCILMWNSPEHPQYALRHILREAVLHYGSLETNMNTTRSRCFANTQCLCNYYQSRTLLESIGSQRGFIPNAALNPIGRSLPSLRRSQWPYISWIWFESMLRCKVLSFRTFNQSHKKLSPWQSKMYPLIILSPTTTKLWRIKLNSTKSPDLLK